MNELLYNKKYDNLWCEEMWRCEENKQEKNTEAYQISGRS